MVTGLETVFGSALGQTVLVFILVFTLVFAVLQKSKILGEGRKQTDALIALAIGLLVISVGYAMDIITKLVPFLAVSLVVILVFLLLLGFFYKGEFEAHKGVKIAAGIISLLAVIIAVLYVTGAWDHIYDLVLDDTSSLVGNIVLLVIVVVVIAVALGFSGSDKKKE